MKQYKSRELDMCNGPLCIPIIKFALPLVATGVIKLLFSAFDLIIISKYAGEDALAAVGANVSLINLMINLFLGLSVGANILAARYLGEKDYQKVKKVVHTSILVAALSGIFVCILGIVFSRTLLTMIKTPENILDMTVVYLNIYFLSMPAMIIYDFGAAIMRAKGETKKPFYYLSISGVVKLILNLLFVAKLNLSVQGVATATVIAQLIAAALIIINLRSDEGYTKLILKELRIDKEILVKLFRVGLPVGVQSCMFALSNVIIQSSINGFGETVIAANTAVFNIESFIYMASAGFAQANIAFSSQNFGAKNYQRIKPIFFICTAMGVAVATILGGLAVIFGQQLLGIYVETPEAIAEGMKRLIIVCVPYGLCALMDGVVGSIRGLGYSIAPMIASFVGICGVRIFWCSVLLPMPKFYYTEFIYYSYIVTWTITIILDIVILLYAYKKVSKTENEVN